MSHPLDQGDRELVAWVKEIGCLRIVLREVSED